MNYTHNLNILLFDEQLNLLEGEDETLLNEIKHELCQNNTIDIEWNGKLEKITIKWDKKELNKIEKHFMGDLFAYPAYDFDSIILNHVKQIISRIQNETKYTIQFHLSRTICNKKFYGKSIGFIN